MATIFFEHSCRACASAKCLKIGSFPLNDHRKPARSDLFICLECKTCFFTHPSRVTADTLSWHRQVSERNTGWSEVLFAHLQQIGVPSRRVIDIGCGPGTMLRYLRDARGTATMGFDTNEGCIRHGAETFGLDLRAELFHARHPGAAAFDADLLTAIMVFEHLDEPALLASEMANYCRAHGAMAYVSVPFINDLSHFDFNKAHNIFNDVGGHVVYFSYDGLTRLFKRYGLKLHATVDTLKIGWHGLLFGA
jgi:2-polyprenyl-3-methyl-5-hydroxy-6-metoxy-1,4-benzoquinol methylase